MPIAGQAPHNVVGQVQQVVLNFIKKRPAGCTPPSDGLILKLHYKFSFWFLLFIFSVVWYAWYHSELMVCVSKFNAETGPRVDYINFCTSYVYVQNENDIGTRRYLFFYKWLHYISLILACVCYIPRKLSKSFENPRALGLFNELSQYRSKYDQKTEQNILQRVSQYIKANLLTHNTIYFNALGCNLVCLVIDCFLWWFLDFVLHNRFINLGWKSIPFHRDPVHYTDYLSRAFPPFSECNIGQQHELISFRSETFGCHLVLMEFYEKVFVTLWVWLLFLTTATVLYVIFLLLLFIPKFRYIVVRTDVPEFAEDEDEFADPKDSVEDLFTHIVKKCKIGDVWLLYKLKRNLSPHRYYMLLVELAAPTLENLSSEDPTVQPAGKGAYPQLAQQMPQMHHLHNNMALQQHHPQHLQQMMMAGQKGKR